MVLYIIGLGLGDEKDITVRYVAIATWARGADALAAA
jgi:diphthamide biosynthesis methyltransferase